MDNYKVNLNARAYRDIENIFSYIALEKFSPDSAKGQTDRIFDTLKSLETFPYAHQERNAGKYANKGYRQLIIDNYIAIYRIDEEKKEVHIITVQYQRKNI